MGNKLKTLESECDVNGVTREKTDGFSTLKPASIPAVVRTEL